MKRYGFSLLLLALMIVLSSCDGVRSIYLEARETIPPTFSATGNDWITGLEVEVFPQNESLAGVGQAKGETIWKITAPKEIWATDWPLITYGHIPDGFSQMVPAQGQPPDLIEGRIYVARPFDRKGPQGSSYFAIRGGKTVNVT